MPKPAVTRRTKSTPRPALSPFLYDLSAAANALPPAAVLPEQFYRSPVSSADSRGEVALMRAVLEDAIHCFQKQARKSGHRVQRLAREAEEWLFDNNQRWPFSFVNICHVLGIDPEYIRRGLRQRQKADSLAPMSPRRESALSGALPIAA